jgi:hypothetical protein
LECQAEALYKFCLLANFPTKEPLEVGINYQLRILVHIEDFAYRKLIGVSLHAALRAFDFLG